MDDDKLALKILSEATPAQQDGFQYFNNFAVSLARIGQTDTAKKMLDRVDYDHLSQRDRCITIATEGLIKFRSGDTENGRKYYQLAINEFDKLGNSEEAAVASYYLAEEEKHVKSIEVDKIVQEARKRLGKYKIPILDNRAKKLLD